MPIPLLAPGVNLGCKQGRALDGAIKQKLGLLGPARDWDVFLAGIGADMAALLPEDKRLKSLLRAAEAKRQAAYGALAEALDGPAWRGAVIFRAPWRNRSVNSVSGCWMSRWGCWCCPQGWFMRSAGESGGTGRPAARLQTGPSRSGRCWDRRGGRIGNWPPRRR